MAKSKANPLWKEKILEWEQSRKNLRAWCKENNIPYTTACGWRNRIKNSQEKKNLPSKTQSKFIELKEQKDPTSSGIILEYNEVKLHIKANFDAIALKRCLDCLRGMVC